MSLPGSDPDRPARLAQVRVLRALEPARRLQLALDMSLAARALALSRLRQRHPASSAAAMERELLRLLYPDVVLPPPSE